MTFDAGLSALMDQVTHLIMESSRVVVFTGAGVSTESGIPDFRGPHGIWTRYDPNEFLYQKFISSAEARKKAWQFYQAINEWADAQPNPAHHAVAELERLGKLDCVITQNVDGLHQRAGNAEEKVIQLHGNIQWVRCLSCRRRYPMAEIQGWLARGVEIPECESCNGILKPETISFGQPMPVEETREAERRSRQCDLCIAIGSSLVVYPAAHMPMYALHSGAKLVIINEGETPLDKEAHVRIHSKAGAVMEEILRRVKQRMAA